MGSFGWCDVKKHVLFVLNVVTFNARFATAFITAFFNCIPPVT